MLTKSEKIKRYLLKHPDANIQDIAAKFDTHPTFVYQIRRNKVNGEPNLPQNNIDKSKQTIQRKKAIDNGYCPVSLNIPDEGLPVQLLKDGKIIGKIILTNESLKYLGVKATEIPSRGVRYELLNQLQLSE